MSEYKGYRVVPSECSTVRIMNLGKGAIPKVLGGVFTSRYFAFRAIDSYLESKGVVDGKANSGSRG